MGFIVHTIPEGQREVERLEKQVQDLQQTIQAMSQKASFDAENYVRERAIDITKNSQQWLLIEELKGFVAWIYQRLGADEKLTQEIEKRFRYLKVKYPDL